ncbi:ArsR/SmtB family transcription factor [Alicyclobacillus mengziensis]|uniref:ArsR family transcriptional regulator n=1 Tax=Alicyclobacillus mengziensis TaxID=2931921 RepID=A0A9X7Z8T8_9BACL|nr:metalloregulator ArsR/SmtB family transcription factor [Alicyclobacillus mengziensis]QSO48723.1 ArsR family transcriptional regulator [Alicyclobacillus mengziensis]
MFEHDTRAWKDAIYSQFARIGKALSSPKRLEILELLSQGPKTVETLARETEASVANVSQHLQVLLQARMVRFEKQGTYAVYQLSSGTTNKLLLLFEDLGEEILAEINQLREELTNNTDFPEPLSLEELETRLSSGDITLIDVRPKEEYDVSHIPGAISIPITELQTKLSSLPRDKEIVSYCRGPYCVYAIKATEVLSMKGFKALRLQEGVREWNERHSTDC